MCPRDTWSGFVWTLESLAAFVGSDTGGRNRVDRCREHGGLGFGLYDAAASDCGAGRVHDRSHHREVPGDGEIAPEDALFLAAFDERLYLVEHGDVTAVEFLRREPGGVEREQAVELGELPPGGSEHALERLGRLATVGLGASHRLDDLCGCVLHDGVEESCTCRKVDPVGKAFERRRWGGEFGEYTDFGGTRLPAFGEAWWELPEGRFVYWRGRITTLELVGDR
jgi:uncharacterized protein DUF6544